MPSNKLLLNDFTIVTMNRNREVLEHAHLIVENGQIQEVAAGPATGDFAEVIDGGGRQVLMPGLVNTHCHAPMTLMRGYGGGHDLQTWLNDYIFPVEAKLTPAAIRAGTELAAAYPLQLIGWKTKARDNSSYFTHPWLAQTQETVLWINPLDAEARGIADGDIVKVANDRGALKIAAKVTSRIVPGGTHSEASWEKQLPFMFHTLMYEVEE